MKKLTIFDHLKNLTVYKKDLNINDMSSYDPYMINRFVSMKHIFLPFVEIINRYSNLKKKVHYDYYKSILPKRNIYFQYIKKGKEYNKTEKEFVAKYFQVGMKDAEEYINILTKSQIDEIINKYSSDIKKTKNL